MGVLQDAQPNSFVNRRGVEVVVSYKRFIFVGICLVLYISWAFWVTGPAKEIPFTPTPNSAIKISSPSQVPIEIKSEVQVRLEASEKVYQRYKAKRQARVGGHPENVVPWPNDVVMYYWDYFLPTFTCPHLIERIGGLGDGGKWVCGLELYEEDPRLQASPEETSSSSSVDKKESSCVIYSLGVATEYSFEEEILDRIKGCQVYGYDASVHSMGKDLPRELQLRIHFHEQFVGVNNSKPYATLKTMMEKNGHKWIDILKMDVEGAEIDVLGQIMDDFEILPFNQLQIEVHGDEDGDNFKYFYKIWERMEGKGLRAFKNEMNHWPPVRRAMKPIYAEYSFINTKGCEFNRLIC